MGKTGTPGDFPTFMHSHGTPPFPIFISPHNFSGSDQNDDKLPVFNVNKLYFTVSINLPVKRCKIRRTPTHVVLRRLRPYVLSTPTISVAPIWDYAFPTHLDSYKQTTTSDRHCCHPQHKLWRSLPKYRSPHFRGRGPPTTIETLFTPAHALTNVRNDTSILLLFHVQNHSKLSFFWNVRNEDKLQWMLATNVNDSLRTLFASVTTSFCRNKAFYVRNEGYVHPLTTS